MPPYKFIPLNETLAAYLDAHRFDRNDPLLQELRQETLSLGPAARLQIDPIQGALFSILVAATGTRIAVEVGTFTGYSAISIARALPPDGVLHCFDINPEFTAIARKYWQKAGLADRIHLHLGPAAQTLPQFCPPQIDFAFIDADKPGYDTYYELLLPRLRPGGLILFDNMLSHGRVVDPDDSDPNARAIRALNDKLASDPRVQAMIIPIADGVTVCLKK